MRKNHQKHTLYLINHPHSLLLFLYYILKCEIWVLNRNQHLFKLMPASLAIASRLLFSKVLIALVDNFSFTQRLP